MSVSKNCFHRAKFSSAATRGTLQCINLILLCSVTSLVSAQQLVDISSCARITDDKARFACYDNLARAAGALPASPTPAVSATAVAPPAPAASTSAPPTATNTASAPVAAPMPPASAKPAVPNVSASTDSARIAAFGSTSSARIEADAKGQEMLVDTVSSLKLIKQDVWQITLGSGQVWRQMVDGRFLLREGDKVHIVPNPWGNSYRLSVDGRNGFIQVQKVANK